MSDIIDNEELTAEDLAAKSAAEESAKAEADAKAAADADDAKAEALAQRTAKMVLDALDQRAQAAKPKEEEDISYDPKEIARQSTTSSFQLFNAFESAKQELTDAYPELTAAERNDVMKAVGNMNPDQVAQVLANKGHLHMAAAVFGQNVKSGKIKMGATAPRQPNPIGGDSPRTGGEGKTGIASQFEKLFGKPTDKAQAQRLKEAGSR